MRFLVSIISVFVMPLIVQSCGNIPQSSEQLEKKDQVKTKPKAAWIDKVHDEVAALGAKNWILVTESAYPTPKDPGAHVLVVDAPLPKILAEVTEAIESEGHIWPRIYTLREFDYLKKDYAPGVKKLRARREAALSAKKYRTVTNSTMNTLLKIGMKDYRVLMIKSTSAYPYSSVFMELDSGYWNGESEEALRQGMKNKKSSNLR